MHSAPELLVGQRLHKGEFLFWAITALFQPEQLTIPRITSHTTIGRGVLDAAALRERDILGAEITLDSKGLQLIP